MVSNPHKAAGRSSAESPFVSRTPLIVDLLRAAMAHDISCICMNRGLLQQVPPPTRPPAKGAAQKASIETISKRLETASECSATGITINKWIYIEAKPVHKLWTQMNCRNSIQPYRTQLKSGDM
eukprot:2963772-Amphidinium_carterae.1